MSILSDEITSDPLTRGYTSMTDQEVVDDINSKHRSRPVETVKGSDIFNATDDIEFTALSEGHKSEWVRLCSVEEIDIANGIAKAREDELFGSGTTTRTNLLALKTESISRAAELGLAVVNLGMIQASRN